MKIRNLILLLLLILMAVFLIINWGALSTDVAVNLVYTEIQAPLGIIVVVCFALLLLIVLGYMLWQAASVTHELRAAYKEARSARAVADDAEKSRFAESNKLLLERIDKLETALLSRSDEMLSKIAESSSSSAGKLDAFMKDQKESSDSLKSEVAKLTETLPAAEEAAKDEQEGKKQKNMFGELF